MYRVNKYHIFCIGILLLSSSSKMEGRMPAVDERRLIEERHEKNRSKFMYSDIFSDEQKQLLKRYPRLHAPSRRVVIKSKEPDDIKWLQYLADEGIISPEMARIQSKEKPVMPEEKRTPPPLPPRPEKKPTPPPLPPRPETRPAPDISPALQEVSEKNFETFDLPQEQKATKVPAPPPPPPVARPVKEVPAPPPPPAPTTQTSTDKKSGLSESLQDQIKQGIQLKSVQDRELKPLPEGEVSLEEKLTQGLKDIIKQEEPQVEPAPDLDELEQDEEDWE